MNKWALVKSDTLVAYTVTFNDDNIPLPETSDGSFFIAVPIDSNDELLMRSWYDKTNGGVFTILPDKPSEDNYYKWCEDGYWEVDLERTEQEALLKRQKLLFKSDWTQLPDVPLVTKEMWATYRQQLRDITTQTSYPINIVWPITPN